MEKPKLLYESLQGASIHSYDLPGGKSTFNRYIACYKDVCVFNKSLEEAENYLFTHVKSL